MGIEEFGGPEKLKQLDLPEPKVGPDSVLIRIEAAGINPVDHKLRAGGLEGSFPHVFPVVPGWDAGGVVEQVGPAVRGFAPGDRVYAYCRKHFVGEGTYAEYVSVPDTSVAKAPETLDALHAGALPLAGLTAWQALVDAAGVEEGETVLVQAAAGGVGGFAAQIAKARGAHVLGTSSAAKHDHLRDLGVDEPIDYREQGVAEAARETHPDGVDVAFDLFGGEPLAQALDAVRDGGRIVSIADPLQDERYRARGIEPSYVFVRPSGTQLGELARLADEGALRVHLERSFPLTEASAAHELLEDGHVTGKVVLDVAA